MTNLADLRSRHSKLYFDEVVLDQKENNLHIFLKYHLENGPEFVTEWCFPHLSPEKLATKDEDLIKLWATHLGMVELLSYWKSCCSPEIIIRVPGITKEQFPFWLNLLHKGMSEFFFVHQIDGWKKGFVTFKTEVADEDQPQLKPNETSHPSRLLIPVGGGKDSIVTSELLRALNMPITTFNVDSYAQPYLPHVVDTFWNGAEQRNHITVQRRLDWHLFELIKEGYYNGHTPFSAMLAFASTLTAYLYDFQYVPLSNEWSANEGNTVFLDQKINHQYSKTIEFEKDFREHLRKYLSTTIEYFSFLRPLHELQIAKLFTKYKQYWPVFLSCNRGQKKGVWCGECAKCVFVSVMLSAFLSNEELEKIFHKQILNDENLKSIFDQLIGFTEVKSLDCVGTRDETRAAVALAAQQLNPVPKLIEYGYKKLLETNTAEELTKQAHELLKSYVDQNFLPTTFDELLKKEVEHLDKKTP